MWGDDPPQAGAEADVVPHHVRSVPPAGDFDRDADWPKHVHAVFVGRNDSDRSLLVEFGDIVHAMFSRSVAAHVVDDPAARDHDPIGSLFDALHVPERRMIGNDFTVCDHFDNLPHAPQVGGALDERLAAAREDWRRNLLAVTAGRRMRYRNLVYGPFGAGVHKVATYLARRCADCAPGWSVRFSVRPAIYITLSSDQ